MRAAHGFDAQVHCFMLETRRTLQRVQDLAVMDALQRMTLTSAHGKDCQLPAQGCASAGVGRADLSMSERTSAYQPCVGFRGRDRQLPPQVSAHRQMGEAV